MLFALSARPALFYILVNCLLTQGAWGPAKPLNTNWIPEAVCPEDARDDALLRRKEQRL